MKKISLPAWLCLSITIPQTSTTPMRCQLSTSRTSNFDRSIGTVLSSPQEPENLLRGFSAEFECRWIRGKRIYRRNVSLLASTTRQCPFTRRTMTNLSRWYRLMFFAVLEISVQILVQTSETRPFRKLKESFTVINYTIIGTEIVQK